MSYSASLAPAGDALPSWLAFDAPGLFFSGVAPPSAGVWNVQLCGRAHAGAFCEGFEVVVSSTPRPGEIEAGQPHPSASTPPSSASIPSSAIITPSGSPTPSASPTMPNVRLLQRLNITTGLVDQPWAPLTSELSAVLDGPNSSVEINCSAVAGLEWSDRSVRYWRVYASDPLWASLLTACVYLLHRAGTFIGNIKAELATDESFPPTAWTPTRSSLILPVVIEYGNGSSASFGLPVSIYPALLPPSLDMNATAIATPGQMFGLDLASDAVKSADGTRPLLTIASEPSEAASWLVFDAVTGQLAALSSSSKVDGSKTNMVPFDLPYPSITVTVEAHHSVLNATSRRSRTITLSPRQAEGRNPNVLLVGMRLVGVIIGTVAALGLFLLLVYLARQPQRRHKWGAMLQATFARRRHDSGESPAAASSASRPQQMAQHSSLTHIDELKYDVERGAFDTHGSTTDPSSAFATTPHSSPTSSTNRLGSASSVTALSIAVGRIVSLTRRVISGSSVGTKVGSLKGKTWASPAEETASQKSTSTYIWVFPYRRVWPARSDVESVGSMSSLGSALPLPLAAHVADTRRVLSLPFADRLASNSTSLELPSVHSEKASLASWESPKTYRWSARSVTGRPSGEAASKVIHQTEAPPPRRATNTHPGDLSIPSDYSTDTSLAYSLDEAIISVARRASSTFAECVRVSNPPSIITSAAVEVTPTAIAPALIVDSNPSPTQRPAVAPMSTIVTLIDSATLPPEVLFRSAGQTDRSSVIDLSDERFGSDYSSHRSDGSIEEIYSIDDVAPPALCADNSSDFPRPPRGRIGNDPCTRPERSVFSCGTASSSSAALSVISLDVGDTCTASTRSSSVVDLYELRTNEPFVFIPSYDPSIVASGRLEVNVHAYCSLVDGPAPLPPWLTFREGGFEAWPKDSDEGDWEIVIVRLSSLVRSRLLWPTTLTSVTLRVGQVNASSETVICCFFLRVTRFPIGSSVFNPSPVPPVTSLKSLSSASSSAPESSTLSGLSAKLTSPTPDPRTSPPSAFSRKDHRLVARRALETLSIRSTAVAV